MPSYRGKLDTQELADVIVYGVAQGSREMRDNRSGVLVAAACFGRVTWERILRAEREPQNWLTYSGTSAKPALQCAREIALITSRTWNL